MTSHISGCSTQVVNLIRQDRILEERLLIIEFIGNFLPIKLTMLITYLLELKNSH
jgi:hypothetical protein